MSSVLLHIHVHLLFSEEQKFAGISATILFLLKVKTKERSVHFSYGQSCQFALNYLLIPIHGLLKFTIQILKPFKPTPLFGFSGLFSAIMSNCHSRLVGRVAGWLR